ncbi:hypothetical protein [uncultured Methanobrevibacter sp.]|uniref:hypothetical protein n=1 Tax=uncultured Methanobrevibacter sp. TaxID=253161 RepID=UPI0025D08896|nr:hypothetical protein [uncultured Methanobrevibacter sp.]
MDDVNVVKDQTINIIGEMPVLFKLGLKALIKAKSDALIQLRELELDLLNAKHDLADKERIILLTTDFKELGLTNEKMRNAYVSEKLSDVKIKIDVKKHTITSKKDDIEIMNDLIRLNELELQGE